MDKSFLAYQISSYKSLVDLFKYEFVSQSNTYKLFEMVKTHYIESKPNPILVDILSEKSSNNETYFRINFAKEYSDIFYNAENFDNVAKKFVELYYAYNFYDNKKYNGVIDFSYMFSGKSAVENIDDWRTKNLAKNIDLGFDIDNVAYTYNPDLKKWFLGVGDFEVYYKRINSYYGFRDVLTERLSFTPIFGKGKGSFVFSEAFKSIVLNQAGVTGIYPLNNFNWGTDEINKQIEFKINEENDYDTEQISDATIIQSNNILVKNFIDYSKQIESKKSANYGDTYIGKINKKSICKSNILFYALSQIKNENGEFLKTAFNVVLNRERTISGLVDGYDFMYAMLLLSGIDDDEFCDIYLDSENNTLNILGERKNSLKIQTGFDSTTFTPIYEFVDVVSVFQLPLIVKDYPKVINECWLYSYSSASTIKEIIEYTKEAEDIVKINIPTEFLNQKEIITKEQLFKIETIEERLAKTKATGKEYLDKLVSYCEDFVLTYADKVEETIIDENFNEKKVTTYKAKENLQNLYLYDNVPNYDYVWKVNELFWKYNKAITIRELIAYFVAKGDQFNYRLLSYRILGVDCYTLKSRLLEQLLIESLVFIESFNINLDEKSIETPMKISYKYEYGTGNYYEKRKKLRSTNTAGLSVLPMNESIMMYFGDALGEVIVQNHISFLDNELIKPKQMTWSGKDTSKLLCSPTDPIFITDINKIQSNLKRRGSSYGDNVLKLFNSFIGRTTLTNSSVTRQQILHGYIMRLPESVIIPLSFIQTFNCYKIAVLPKEDSNNTKGQDVFAVYGAYDLTNSDPLFIGNNTINDNDCNDFIAKKPNRGSISFARKRTSTGSDNGTYFFSKQLKNLTATSFSNLYEGKFITKDESDTRRISAENKKKIVNEILIAFNQHYPKVIMEGDYQFNKFMQDSVDDIDALKVQQIWNETYNYEMYPKKMVKATGFDEYVSKLNNEKFPIFIEHSRFFGKDTRSEFLLNDNQIDGIKYYVGNKNSGLLAHEVGFGKTSTSICSISHQILTGESNRVMISVPNAVYVNFIREIKGEKSKEGYVRRGLLPTIDVVELKNARKDVFIKYDKRTFAQTGGVKKYTTNQIKNIDSYRDIVKEIVKSINPSKNKYNVLYVDKFESYNSKIDEFIKYVEKVFDKKLLDWRLDDFFSRFINSIRDVSQENKNLWLDALDELESEESGKIQRLENKNPPDLTSKTDKINKDYKNKKEKKFIEISKLNTINIVYTFKSSEQQIYDEIGTYEDSFQKNNSIVICTHEAIGQLRLNRNTALEVSNSLKDSPLFARSLLNNAISFDKLNIDSLIVDEIHNFNEIFNFSKRQICDIDIERRKGTAFRRDDYGLTYFEGLKNLLYAKKRRGNDRNSVTKFNMTAKATSTKKATLYGICKALQSQVKTKNKYNIMLLSATPFVDDLFQMIGVFNMLREFETPIEFFANYLYQDWDWENDHKGETVLKVQTSTFKNDEARNNWIKLFSQFYTYDARINQNRPNKFTYPYDCKSNNEVHYLDNCDSNVYLDFTKEQYAIYENIGKYLEGKIGYDNIVPSVKGKPVDTTIFIDQDIVEILKECVDENSPNYSPEQAVQIFVEENYIEVLNDSKNKYYDEISEIYSIIKNEVDVAIGLIEQQEEEESVKQADEDEGLLTEDVNDASSYSGIGNEQGGQRALRGQDLGKKLALSPYLVTPKDAEEGYVNPNLPPLYGISTPQNKSASAKNFVETSPKIYFVCKSIQCLIDHHNERKEDITGQLIYISFGQKFLYGGVRYNAMDLIKTYLEDTLDMKGTFTATETDEFSTDENPIKKEYKLSQVQIVSGLIQDPLYKNAISGAFNEGKIKVLIGSATIKEGINLQGSKEFNHGNSTIYVTTSDYAPMVYMQLEGRVWRQGNPLENVRMVYPLIKNSIDLHIYSKLKEKITKVKNMLEAGIYNFKETQFEKDIEGVSLVLNTNIDEKLKVIWSKQSRKLDNDKKATDSVKYRLDKVKLGYSQTVNFVENVLTFFNPVAKTLQDYYASLIIKEIFDKEKRTLNAKYSVKKDEIAKNLSKKYEQDLAKYEKEKDENEKLNEENKKKKLPSVPFNLVKPLKKDDIYTPDYTQLEADQDKEFLEVKKKIVNDVMNNIADKKYSKDEMYYYSEIKSNSPYGEILSGINEFLNNTQTVFFDKLSDSTMLKLKNDIDTLNYYFAFSSKSEMLSYTLTTEYKNNNAKWNDINNYFGRIFLVDRFKELLQTFGGGGDIQIVLSDYQELVYSRGKNISDIDSLINDYQDKIIEINTKLSNKNEFLAEKRQYFIEEDNKLKAERERLVDMKDYVMVDVNKFCKTNKFIYMRGSLTQEQVKEMFATKK